MNKFYVFGGASNVMLDYSGYDLGSISRNFNIHYTIVIFKKSTDKSVSITFDALPFFFPLASLKSLTNDIALPYGRPSALRFSRWHLLIPCQ